ncbi:hypothetical protein U1Q18_013856 [Sarracenia purpurea var. burkii]
MLFSLFKALESLKSVPLRMVQYEGESSKIRMWLRAIRLVGHTLRRLLATVPAGHSLIRLIGSQARVTKKPI